MGRRARPSAGRARRWRGPPARDSRAARHLAARPRARREAASNARRTPGARRGRRGSGRDPRGRSGLRADLAPSLAVLAAVLVAAGWVQVAVGLRPLDAVRRRLADVRSGRRRGLERRSPTRSFRSPPRSTTCSRRRKRRSRGRGRARPICAQPEVSLTVLAADAEELRAGGAVRIADEIAGLTEGMRRYVERELARARAGIRARAGAPQPVRPSIDQVVGVLRRTPREGRSTGRSTSPTASALPSTRRTSSRSSAISPRTPPNGPPPRCASAVGATAPRSCSRSRTTGRAFLRIASGPCSPAAGASMRPSPVGAGSCHRGRGGRGLRRRADARALAARRPLRRAPLSDRGRRSRPHVPRFRPVIIAFTRFSPCS